VLALVLIEPLTVGAEPDDAVPLVVEQPFAVTASSRTKLHFRIIFIIPFFLENHASANTFCIVAGKVTPGRAGRAGGRGAGIGRQTFL